MKTELTPEELELINNFRKEKVKKKLKIRELTEISVEEKCHRFDELYNFAKEILTFREKNESFKDADHYCFESIMELLVKSEKRKEFWDYWKKL